MHLVFLKQAAPWIDQCLGIAMGSVRVEWIMRNDDGEGSARLGEFLFEPRELRLHFLRGQA